MNRRRIRYIPLLSEKDYRTSQLRINKKYISQYCLTDNEIISVLLLDIRYVPKKLQFQIYFLSVLHEVSIFWR